MVSKTVLACLVVLASFSMIQATSSLTEFSPCVQGLGFINYGSGLGFDLGSLLSGVLGVTVEIVNTLLLTLQGILVGVLATVGNLLGLLGGLFGGTAPSSPSNPPSIPCPDTLDKFIQVQLKFATVYDKYLTNKFSGVWQSGTLVNVYLNLLDLLAVKLNIGGTSYGTVPDISTTKQQCSQIISGLSQWESDKNFTELISIIKVYLSILDSDTIDEKCFTEASSSLIKIHIGLLQLGGYPSISDYSAGFSKSWSLLNLDANVFGLLDLDVNLGGTSGIPYQCGCLN